MRKCTILRNLIPDHPSLKWEIEARKPAFGLTGYSKEFLDSIHSDDNPPNVIAMVRYYHQIRRAIEDLTGVGTAF